MENRHQEIPVTFSCGKYTVYAGYSDFLIGFISINSKHVFICFPVLTIFDVCLFDTRFHLFHHIEKTFIQDKRFSKCVYDDPCNILLICSHRDDFKKMFLNL